MFGIGSYTPPAPAFARPLRALPVTPVMFYSLSLAAPPFKREPAGTVLLVTVETPSTNFVL